MNYSESKQIQCFGFENLYPAQKVCFVDSFHPTVFKRFVLQIQTNSTCLNYYFYELHPRTKSVRIRLSNADFRVRKSRFVRIQDSWVWICKDLFHTIVLKICEDLLVLWKQVNSFENWLDSWSRIKSTNQIQIRIFTNLLYESRNLTFITSFLITKKW